MRLLGTAKTDLTKGIATLAVLLALVAAFKKADVIYRVAAAVFVTIVYMQWYYRKCTFWESKMSVSQGLITFFNSSRIVFPSSIDRIIFHTHGTAATGTYVYINYRKEEMKDVIALNFKRDYLFILEFAVLNDLVVDTGGIDWIELAYSDIASRYRP